MADAKATDRHEPLGAVVAVDHEARTAAALANQKIDKHEDHCGERWAAANKALDGLRQDVKDIHHRINSLVRVAFSLIIALGAFAAVQWLLASGVAQ